METCPLDAASPRIFTSLITKFISHKSRTKPLTRIGNVCLSSDVPYISRDDFEESSPPLKTASAFHSIASAKPIHALQDSLKTPPRVLATFPPKLNWCQYMFTPSDTSSGHGERNMSSYLDDIFNRPLSPPGSAHDSTAHNRKTDRKGIITSPVSHNPCFQMSNKSSSPEQHFYDMEAQLDDTFKALFCSKTKADPVTAPQASRPLVLTHVKPISPRRRPRKTPELMQTIAEEFEEEQEDEDPSRRASLFALDPIDFQTPPMTPLKAANKAKCPQLNIFLESFPFFIESSPSSPGWSPRTPGTSP